MAFNEAKSDEEWAQYIVPALLKLNIIETYKTLTKHTEKK